MVLAKCPPYLLGSGASSPYILASLPSTPLSGHHYHRAVVVGALRAEPSFMMSIPLHMAAFNNLQDSPPVECMASSVIALAQQNGIQDESSRAM